MRAAVSRVVRKMRTEPNSPEMIRQVRILAGDADTLLYLLYFYCSVAGREEKFY